MSTNPYQAPDSVPDGPANLDFDSLPLTLPRRSRLDRVYPILLGVWAGGMAVLSLYDAGLVDLIFTAYFAGLILASVGVWRWSRTAEVVAIIQLAIVWLLAVLFLALVAWALVLPKAPPPPDGFVLITLFVLFLPTTIFLILAGLVWRQRSN